MKELIYILIAALLSAAAAITMIPPAQDAYVAGENQIDETNAVLQPQFDQLNQLTAELKK